MYFLFIASCFLLCAKLEEEASLLDADSSTEFLSAYGSSLTGLEQVVRAANSILNRQCYYTLGPMGIFLNRILVNNTQKRDLGS